VSSLTYEEGKRGTVEDVAQMMRSARPSAFLTSGVGRDVGRGPWARRRSTVVLVNLADILLCRDKARSFLDRLMMVQCLREGKWRRCRSRWESICWPAPKAMIYSG